MVEIDNNYGSHYVIHAFKNLIINDATLTVKADTTYRILYAGDNIQIKDSTVTLDNDNSKPGYDIEGEKDISIENSSVTIKKGKGVSSTGSIDIINSTINSKGNIFAHNTKTTAIITINNSKVDIESQYNGGNIAADKLYILNNSEVKTSGKYGINVFYYDMTIDSSKITVLSDDQYGLRSTNGNIIINGNSEVIGSATYNGLIAEKVIIDPSVPMRVDVGNTAPGTEVTGSPFSSEVELDQSVTDNKYVHIYVAPTQYTVKFMDGAKELKSSVKVYENDKVTKPEDPKKEGYTFGGWYTDNTYATTFDFDKKITKNTEIYAKLEIKKYTVTFDLDGGSMTESNSVSVDHGNKVTEPTSQTKTGFIFDGWYKEATFNNPFDFSTETIKADIIIYAKFIEQVTVKFDFNGATNNGIAHPYGTSTKGSTIDYNTLANLIKDPSNVTPQTGKEFSHFEIKGSDWKSGIYTVNEDIEIKIIWKDKSSGGSSSGGSSSVYPEKTKTGKTETNTGKTEEKTETVKEGEKNTSSGTTSKEDDSSETETQKNDTPTIKECVISGEVSFTDIDVTFAKCYIQDLANKGYIKGYGDGTFRPENNITRGEFLAIVMRSLEIDLTTETKHNFKDLAETSDWTKYVNKAIDLGIISKDNENFRADESITREEAMKILMMALGVEISELEISSYKDVNGWNVKYIEKARELGIITPENENFKPQDKITRAEVAKIVYNVVSLKK